MVFVVIHDEHADALYSAGAKAHAAVDPVGRVPIIGVPKTVRASRQASGKLNPHSLPISIAMGEFIDHWEF
jgi:hypothetical protein